MAWVEPHFDNYAFAGKRAKAVSIASHISFQDYSRMHVQRKAKAQERRLPTPDWSIRNEWLQVLLVTYLEERFYCTPAAGASLDERLKTARAAAIYYAPRKRELLKDWIKDYHTISACRFQNLTDDEAIEKFLTLREVHGQLPISAEIARTYLSAKKLHDLEIQIQNVDTDLVLTEKGHAEVIAAVVYLYYRLRWDSVTIAEQLGLKSPHVRQVLARLHATWRTRLSHLAGVPLEPVQPESPLDEIFA